MGQATSPSDDDGFDAAFEAFMDRLETDIDTNASSIFEAFPERKEEIESLVLAARRELRQASLGSLPPMPVDQLSGPSPSQPGWSSDFSLPLDIGDYRLVSKLGGGGMGDVFLATQLRPIERQVAVKLLKSDLGGRESSIRFENERRSLARMNHPNIAIILDGGMTKEGQPFLVMEWVDGLNLLEFCRRNVLDIRSRLQIFLKVCSGVQHAHQKGVIHRDLKPSNILIAEIDGHPTPKVIDFGLAKAFLDRGAFESTNTQLGQILGTLQYMSPEQASLQSDQVDTRSDVFSLGVILYELLTGTTPLDKQLGTDLPIDERLRRIRQQEPLPPSYRIRRLQRRSGENDSTDCSWNARSLRGDLDAICLKALAPDPSGRYESVAGLADDVQRFLDDRPVLAGKTSEWQLLLKYAHRHRVAVAATAAVASLLVISTIVSIWMAFSASRSEQIANRRTEQLIESQNATSRALLESQQSLYVAHMNLVQKAIGENDLQLAREYLNRYGNPTILTDLRGFEWFYWKRQIEDYLGECDTGQEAFSVRYSPLGQVFTAGADGRVQAWDPEDRQLIHEFTASRDYLGTIAISGDGQKLATAGRDGHLKVWRWDGAEGLMCDFQEEDMLRCAVFDSTADHVFSGGHSGHVYLWDLNQSERKAKFSAHDRDIYDLDISKDGKWLATASADYSVKIWELPSLSQVASLEGHQGRVRSVRFSPDGSLVASGSNDATAILWDWASGSVKFQLSDHAEAVYGVRFSPDGQTLATCSRDESIKLWEVATGQLTRSIVGHRFTIYDLDFSPNGQRLVSGAHDKTLKFWDLNIPTAQEIFENHSEAARDVVFSQDQKFWASAGDDGEIVIMESDSGSVLNRLQPLRGAAMSLLFLAGPNSDSTPRLLSGFEDGSMQVYSVPEGETLGEVAAHEEILLDFALAPNGQTFATASGDSSVKVWSAETLELEKELIGHAAPVHSVVYSPDGESLLSGDSEAQIIQWDLATSQPARHFSDHSDRVSEIAFSPDGLRFATGSRDRSVCIYDWQTGDLIQRLRGHSSSISSLAYDTDGNTLMTVGTDMQLKFWDLRTGEVKTSIHAHPLPILRVRMTPDRQFVVTASGDGTIRFWPGG
jgi:eukaryotic-like serine/threonine-protein kinase